MSSNEPKVGDLIAFYVDPRNSRRTIKTQITEIGALQPGRTRRDLVLTVLEQDPARNYIIGEQIQRMEGDLQISAWRDRNAVILPRYLVQGHHLALEIAGSNAHAHGNHRTIRWALTRQRAQQIVQVLNDAVKAGFDSMTAHDQLRYQAEHGAVICRRAVDDPALTEPVVLVEGLRPLYLAVQVAAECQTAFNLGECA
jgi:hypothetical protein